MIYRLQAFVGSAVKSKLYSFQPSIFIALLLFGQIFFSALAYLLGVENRLVILPYRAVMALCSLYIVMRKYMSQN